MLPAKWCSDPDEWSDSNMTCKDDDYLTIPEKCVLIMFCSTHMGPRELIVLISRFLNDNIGLHLATNKTGPLNGNVTLREVEQAIEDLTAAMFWSGMCVGISSTNLTRVTLCGV